MRSMSISKFKATCLAELEYVRRTGRPLLITRFGKPVAEIGPPRAEAAGGQWLGNLRGTAQIRGDIIAPIGSVADWEAAR